MCISLSDHSEVKECLPPRRRFRTRWGGDVAEKEETKTEPIIIKKKEESLSGSLTKQGFLVKKTECNPVIIQKIVKELTAKPIVIEAYKQMSAKEPEFIIYQQSPSYFFLPRFWALNDKEILRHFPFKANKIKPGNPMSDINFIYELLPHQHNGYKAAYKSLTELGGGVLSLPCGYGKTALAIKLAIDMGGKTLVIVNKECLMDQWISAISKFTNDKARIGIIQQDKIDVVDKDFVVGMVHSISKKDYDMDIFSDFHMTIIDECHHLGSEMFSKSLFKVSSPVMLGLSATPIRKDGLSFVVHAHLGPLCHSEKRSGSNKIAVKRFFLTSRDQSYQTILMANGVKNTSQMLTNLSNNVNRNRLIIECIKVLMTEQRKILVLSGRLKQLSDLHGMLETAKIIRWDGKPLTFGYYIGKKGQNKAVHKAMLEKTSKCDVILGTHNIASEGLDIPDLNTEIIASPMSDVEQAIGRILRKFHKLNPIVVDIIDHCGNFVKQGKTRLKLYHSEGYSAYDLHLNIDTLFNSNGNSKESECISKHLLEINESIAIPPSTKTEGKSNEDEDDDDSIDCDGDDDSMVLTNSKGLIRIKPSKNNCMI